MWILDFWIYAIQWNSFHNQNVWELKTDAGLIWINGKGLSLRYGRLQRKKKNKENKKIVRHASCNKKKKTKTETETTNKRFIHIPVLPLYLWIFISHFSSETKWKSAISVRYCWYSFRQQKWANILFGGVSRWCFVMHLNSGQQYTQSSPSEG